MDGRAKPGHDGEGGYSTRAKLTLDTFGLTTGQSMASGTAEKAIPY
jgi:hypothetical protein